MVYGDEYNKIIDELLKKLEEASDPKKSESDKTSQDSSKKRGE